MFVIFYPHVAKNGSQILTSQIFDKVDLALEEILHLQEEGPSNADVMAVLEIEQRAHENGLQVTFTRIFAYRGSKFHLIANIVRRRM